MIIKMVQFGDVLSTRQSGRVAFDQTAALLHGGQSIVFDFDGVDSVTNSFADELFGQLAVEFGMDRLKETTSFVHVNSFSAKSIRRAMDNRAAAVSEIAVQC